ncbi:uncharacterized protein A1O9_03930 [Exophiala aquamarina CBS 119918]|uniref:FAD-binding PCMH-type domain-containing protein n=1 Tax=Exophiala aquamarina CBS 119918 TaxID=1182545 RepID=A0A072PGU3_9EURO|nr:uncharacterized protein A1O9_03930 [Exophiala aquamarina CBS 119918]KEF59086.1 hypothetical protein A1O9_03930 [Exophiala aquamarina CBS 119918]
MALLVAAAATVAVLVYPDILKTGDGGDGRLEYELGPLLSPGASIFLPGTAEFRDKTTRWIDSLSPDIGAVVAVATEEDIQQTVLYSNRHNQPILAFGGGHGAISSMEKVHNGIEIWMGRLNHVNINPDGNSVTIGGGTKSKAVIDRLWAAGKQTVTGVCECVGITGAMLGGGRGTLQGQYGLLSDQLISSRLVLANGTAVTASKEENPDLFWALQGAGHNFGIVIEFTSKIYDARVNKTWVLEELVFTGDKLEELFSVHNRLMESQPPELVLWSFLNLMPEIDPVKPVIRYIMLYDGPVSEQRSYAAPIHELVPISSTREEISYVDIPSKTGTGESDLSCQKGAVVLRFPNDLLEINVSALRQAYETFSDMLAQEQAFIHSFFMIEAFSMQAVHAVDRESTAVPYRHNKLLLSPAIHYFPNKSLDTTAKEWGQRMRDVLLAGSGTSELQAYINYAYGDERIESWYGYEPWRLEKLRRLKREFDPHGKFSFYAPID